MGAGYWLVAYLAMALIAFSKAGFGGGPGVLATPMLAMVANSTTAIAVMLPIMLACDVWCVAIYRRGCVWSKVIPLLIGFFVGMLAGTYLLANVPGQEIWLKKSIGGLSIFFGLSHFLILKNSRLNRYVPQKSWFGVLMGVFGGVVSTLAHAAGPLTAMYFLSQEDDKERFMGSIIVYSFIGNLLKVPSYILSDTMNAQTWHLTWPLLPAVPIGIGLGWYLNKKMSDANFTSWINAVLVIIGVFLVAS
jgi:hypothetical protein